MGDVNAYLEHQKLSSTKELEKKAKVKETVSNKQKENSYEKQKELRGAQQRISKIEKQIADLEKEIKAIDFDLEVDYEKTISQPNFFDSYHAKKKELETLMEKWEELQLQME